MSHQKDGLEFISHKHQVTEKFSVMEALEEHLLDIPGGAFCFFCFIFDVTRIDVSYWGNSWERYI